MLINHSNSLYTQYYRTDISRIMHSSSTLTGADLGRGALGAEAPPLLGYHLLQKSL